MAKAPEPTTQTGAPWRPTQGIVSRIRCAFGWHEWVTGDGHWRRWRAECGNGKEPAPTRPRSAGEQQ